MMHNVNTAATENTLKHYYTLLTAANVTYAKN